MCSRRKKPFAGPGQKIGRVIQNEPELIEGLKQRFPDANIVAKEFFEMTFKEQVTLMQQADILVGMHGAGLANLVYMPQSSHVIELIPFTWKSKEYVLLSGMTGHPYASWQNEKKENHIEPECHELNRRQSASEPNVCRAGASATIVDIDAILDLVQKSINKISRD